MLGVNWIVNRKKMILLTFLLTKMFTLFTAFTKNAKVILIYTNRLFRAVSAGEEDQKQPIQYKQAKLTSTSHMLLIWHITVLNTLWCENSGISPPWCVNIHQQNKVDPGGGGGDSHGNAYSIYKPVALLFFWGELNILPQMKTMWSLPDNRSEGGSFPERKAYALIHSCIHGLVLLIHYTMCVLC